LANGLGANLSSAFVWFWFLLGIASYAIGIAQFFSARLKAPTQPPSEKT
jgi:hypothetical protein